MEIVVRYECAEHGQYHYSATEDLNVLTRCPVCDAPVERREKKIVQNLMSGKDVVIDKDTPLCCDPSSETYWSM